MNKTTFKFAYSSSPLPLLLCRTQSGKKFFALIDTGSEITIIDRTLKEEINPTDKKSDNIILHSMYGEEESSVITGVLKAVILDSEYREHSVRIEGIVNDLSSVSDFMKDTYGMEHNILVIIGSEYLNKNCAVIDCESGNLSLQ